MSQVKEKTARPAEDDVNEPEPESQAVTYQPTDRVEDSIYEGSGTEDDPYVVTWNPTGGDPENPREWSRHRKAVVTAQLALETFWVAACSSTYSGAIPYLMEDLDMSEEMAILGLSVYVLGFGLGPLIFAPLSEIYGRRLVFLATYTPFTLFHLGSAFAQNPTAMIVSRFFAGAFGSAPLTNSGGMIADMFMPFERALPQTLYGTAPLLGPSMGPIIGGFISQSPVLGWRWMFRIHTIVAGANLIFAFPFFPETYAPRLLEKRAERLHKESGGEVFYVDMYHTGGKVSLVEKLGGGLSRPFIFLFQEPIVTALALYSAVFYSTLYAFFAGFSIVFEQGHGFNAGENGLAFLGVGIGTFIGAILAPVQSALYRRHGRKYPAPNGDPHPEARMILPMFGSVCLPVGVFWFAWTSTPSVHWIIPIIAGVPFGIGMSLLMVAINAYLMDAYSVLCASAIAAVVVTRSVTAAAFPLFTPTLLRNLGTEWGLTVFAFLSLACCPLPFLLFRYGQQLRAHSTHASAIAAAALKLAPRPNGPQS